MSRRLAAAAIAVGTGIALTACGGGSSSASAKACMPAHQITTVQKGKLSVALTDAPPYSFEKDGQAAGIDDDILKKVAAQECLALTYTPYTYSTALPAVQTGAVDVAVGGFYRTKNCAAVATLSAPVYLDKLTAMSSDGVSTVDGLMGKKVGAVDETPGVDALRKLLGGSFRTYPDSISLAQDLKASRIDVALDGYGAATQSTKDTKYKIAALEKDARVPITEEPSQTNLLINPKNNGLSSAIDEHINAFRRDGTLVKILEAYGLPASAAEVGPPRPI